MAMPAIGEELEVAIDPKRMNAQRMKGWRSISIAS